LSFEAFTTQWLLVVDVFHVRDLLVGGQRPKMGAEGFEVTLVPGGVCSAVFGLYTLTADGIR
jgi:hypothetical protein